MNRRGFLSILAGAAASPLLDPDRLLWVPGRKLISIPKPQFRGVSVRYIRHFDVTHNRVSNRLDALYRLPGSADKFMTFLMWPGVDPPLTKERLSAIREMIPAGAIPVDLELPVGLDRVERLYV